MQNMQDVQIYNYWISICIGFCYVCSIRRRPPPQQWGGPPSAGPTTVVESIMVDADAANIAKTYANAYRIFAYLHILPIFSEDPYGNPGAI